jgi:hypothetical protein
MRADSNLIATKLQYRGSALLLGSILLRIAGRYRKKGATIGDALLV